MMNMLRSLGRYIFARAQERSTVAGAVAVLGTALGVALPGDQIVNVVVGVAGLLAMVIPGGK
jgi:hypothetical protein